jgi:ketosteroid isomerase-like protein
VAASCGPGPDSDGTEQRLRDTELDMSQRNVEVVRESVAAYGRRDVDTLRRLSDPDVELDWSASLGLQARVYSGFDTALDFYREYFEVFEMISFEQLRFIDDGDSVVVPNIAVQRGRDGIEVTARSTLLFRLRDGLITHIRLYQHTEEALEAIGLAE